MKLSEAIRLGAMMGPQVRGTFSKGNATCALGAAALAGGCRFELPREGAFPTRGNRPATMSVIFPYEWMVIKQEHVCPEPHRVRFRKPMLVSRLIPHLNDYHGWSRERIADWVATIEPAEVQATPAPCEASHEVEVQSAR